MAVRRGLYAQLVCWWAANTILETRKVVGPDLSILEPAALLVASTEDPGRLTLVGSSSREYNAGQQFSGVGWGSLRIPLLFQPSVCGSTAGILANGEQGSRTTVIGVPVEKVPSFFLLVVWAWGELGSPAWVVMAATPLLRVIQSVVSASVDGEERMDGGGVLCLLGTNPEDTSRCLRALILPTSSRHLSVL